MSSQADLATAARLKPDLFETYVALEEKIGKTVFLGPKNVPVPLRQVVAGKVHLPTLGQCGN